MTRATESQGWFDRSLTAVLYLGLSFPVAAEALSQDAALATTAPLFDSNQVLQVKLHGPLQKLLKDTGHQTRIFQIAAAGVQQPVAVTPGGRSRRRVCDFVPLRLNFEADAGKHAMDSVFVEQSFLYLTTQCRSTSRSQADLIEEYLAYRILNLLTNLSYRVRLLRVDYVDTRNAGSSLTHYAFATESQHALADRVGGEVLAIPQVPKRQLNEEHAALVYVFQYLIGNTDWSLVAGDGDETCCHNGQLIGVGTDIFLVPFDFDLAGLVNPPYAHPDRSLPIRKVTQRLYRGYCGPEAALRRAIVQVAGQREAILGLYDSAPALSRSERDRGIRFLQRFFEEAEQPDELLARFQRRCLGKKV